MPRHGLAVRQAIADMRQQGRLTSWKECRGFGFIKPDSGGEPVFVHIKSFSNRRRRPADGERVTYMLAADAHGRPQAESVAYAGDRSPLTIWVGGVAFSLVLTGLFFGFVALAVYAGELPSWILKAYQGTSVLAFLAYAFDKSAAQSGRWRTPESTLHLLGVSGGWPGALLAQRALRHKSGKRSFQAVYWATVGLNCGALWWLFRPSGNAVLRSVLGLS